MEVCRPRGNRYRTWLDLVAFTRAGESTAPRSIISFSESRIRTLKLYSWKIKFRIFTILPIFWILKLPWHLEVFKIRLFECAKSMYQILHLWNSGRKVLNCIRSKLICEDSRIIYLASSAFCRSSSFDLEWKHQTYSYHSYRVALFNYFRSSLFKIR